MKKRVFLKLIALLMILFASKNVYAFDVNNYRYRDLCGTYEVAGFHTDGVIDTVECFNDFNEAKNYMKQNGAEDLAVMTKYYNAYTDSYETKIIDANKALVDLSVNPELLTYFYENGELDSRQYTYMDTGTLYGGVDGALLDSSYSGKYSAWTAKVRIGNFTGWIAQHTYEIVPITWIKSYSYYNVTNESIRHEYISKVQEYYRSSGGSTIGPKPDMLSPGIYISYDGHYFYTYLGDLLQDYKENSVSRSVNKDNPYYNYYMYLSNHTRTTYSSLNIDEYIRNNMGIWTDVYGDKASDGTSRLYGSGTFFYNAQEVYGVNAILSLSLSRNETGNGRSSISINKNNGFGLNAVDTNPYHGASWYASFPSSILGYANRWITYGYAHPRDWRYFGPQFGDKWIGMNVKYASDTYWSEKMAQNYYNLDKAYGMQDYNYYQLGVLTKKSNAHAYPSEMTKFMYEYPEAEDAVVIVGEETYDNILWYKVVSDLNFDSNLNEIYSGPYNWNSYVYVKASDVKKINVGKNGYITPNQVTEYEDKNYTYDLFDSGNVYKPKVGISTKAANYYYDSSLTSQSGKVLYKDRYVMVFAAAYKNNQVVSYLVTSDYYYNQKQWVSASSIKLTALPYGLVNVDTDDNQHTWVNYNLDDAYYSKIGGLYTYTYVPILETVQDGSNVWYKVPVSLSSNDNVYGYTLSRYSDYIWIDVYNSEIVNSAPVITASNQSIMERTSFDPLQGVTATDQEDGDITNKIEVKTNNVNINVPGVYDVVYSVTDSSGYTTTKTIQITIIENKAPVINASDKTILINATFNALEGVTATDEEDGDLTSKITVIENTVNTSKEGTYQVTYQVSDKLSYVVTKTIQVVVIDQAFISTDAIFYFDYLKEVDGKLQIKGYNAIKGMNNTLNEIITYVLVFQSKTNSEEKYELSLQRITDKNEMTRPVNASDGYDYTYSWFKGNITTENIPDGDYELYVKTICNEKVATSIISNKVLRTQATTFKDTKYITTRNNYFENTIPLELVIRSEELGEKTALSKYNQYNQYRALEFVNTRLHIKGTAYSYGMDLSQNASVTRKIIFENTNSYQKYEYELGSITNGMYEVGTTLGDNLNKTRAWFDTTIDISNIPVGNYAIYISNKANISDYGELNELLQRDVSKVKTTIGNKTYSFVVNKNQRYRIELNVE